MNVLTYYHAIIDRERITHMNFIKQNLRLTGVILCIMTIIFGISSFFYVKWVSQLLEQEEKRAVSEATLQASHSIHNKMMGQLDMIDSISLSLLKGDLRNRRSLQKEIESFGKKYGFNRIIISPPDGKAYLSDGILLDISGEEGFMTALKGIANISRPFDDQLSDQEIITINSPLILNGKVVGVLSASRFTKDLYTLLSKSTSFFEGHGYSLIIDREGNVILPSQHKGNHSGLYNIFESETHTSKNNEQLHLLRKGLQSQDHGVGSLQIDNDKKLLAYSKIEGTDEWYIVTVVSKKGLMVKVNAIIVSTYLLCTLVLVILSFMFILILRIHKKTQKEIETMAFVDELTKIPSANKFRIDARHMLNKYPGKPMAIAIFDVYQFKYINEIHGIEKGNYILQFLAAKLQENVSPTDLIGRLTGDRYALLTVYDNEAELLNRMNGLVHLLSELPSQYVKNRVYKLIINCGIYKITDKSMDIHTMLDRARMASKSVKGGHTSACGFFNEEMLRQILHEQNIESCMHEALAYGEFEVYLQPKYNMKANNIESAEALVRWNHPYKGFIPPSEFIPIFEKNGFIINIDLMVFDFACKLIKKWLDLGWRAVPISVNLSRAHLLHPDFITSLLDILDKYEIPAPYIEIELTESIIFEDTDYLNDSLQKLKHIGFTLSIDDFGAGYSSLNLLQSLTVDVIKLDRGFFINDADNNRGKIVVANMIKLAHELDLKVVAEGVETQEQISFLQTMNCDLVQGYFFSKPIPVDQFEAALVPDKSGQV